MRTSSEERSLRVLYTMSSYIFIRSREESQKLKEESNQHNKRMCITIHIVPLVATIHLFVASVSLSIPSFYISMQLR